jgi:hypothetical protein
VTSNGLRGYLLFVGLPFLVSTVHGQPKCNGRASLNAFERNQFVAGSLATQPQASAQFLSEPGCGQAMLDELKTLGATIDYADEKSGYALVTVGRDKLLATLDLAGIAYAYASAIYPNPDAPIPQSERKAEPVPEIQIPYPRVAKILPPDGPFYDAAAIGLPELWKQHPDADGRGVVVAVPDEGFDLLHPALQDARDASGKIVAKIADLGSLTSPSEDAGWVEMNRAVEAKNGRFEAAGRAWQAPGDKEYRFGIYKATLTLGPGSNPHVKKLDLAVGVLWDEAAGKVWVDTNGDGSFADERALDDYGQTHGIAWFGAKTGDDDNRIPFGVKIYSGRKAIYLRVGEQHGALVGGPLAANTWTGGLFDGAAPSAQLVDESLARSTLISAMVKMATRPDVDVINRSGGIGRIGYTGMRAGMEDFALHVVEREIAVYQKPFVAYSAAPGTIHVQDFSPAETLKRNRQLPPPYKDTMNSFVWDGPSGLVNTVLAVSTNLETESRYEPLDLPMPDGKKQAFSETYFDPPAPDGYVIGANPSPTIPVVTGVMADLISEARREHVRYDAVRLNNAIFTGARLQEGFPVSQQGYGLVNAAASWDQLAKMAKADDPANPELTFFTVERRENGKTHVVQGFHAEVARTGDKVEGEIWITRHGGYAGGRKYALSLRGDDKSFELLDHAMTLDRDKPARVRFRASGAAGWNIALLELEDVVADVVMEDVPLSVKAPDVPNEIALGVDQLVSDIPPLRSENRFIEVEPEIQAVRWQIRAPYVGPDSILDAPGIRSKDVVPPGEPVDAAHHVGPMETLESLMPNDSPGIQSIFWENRGRPEYRTPYDPPAPDVPIHTELTMTKFAVAIKREGDKLDLKNELADIDGRAELYDAALKAEKLSTSGPHAMGAVDVTVPANLAEWRLRLTPDEQAEGTSDVYLMNCTGKDGCSVATTEEISPDAKALVIEKPAAGAWKIVVRNRDQVSQGPSYTIEEAQLTPAATSIEAADSEHASGATWTVPLPQKQSDAQYAAFHIAGTPGIENEKNGVIIGMTPLEADAP